MIISDRQTDKAICLILSILITILSISPMRIQADEKDISYYSSEEGLEFEVVTFVSSSWDSYANIELKIVNRGGKKIDDWYLTFNTLYDVEDIWNASIIDSDENGTYLIKCEEWNQDILPGEEISVGMTVYTEDTDISLFSPWYLLNTKVSEVDPDKYALKYEEYSRWETGYSGAIIIETEIPLEDWMIVTDSEYEITEIANANISTEDDRYIIVPADVQNVTVGSSLQLPIKGQITDKDFELRDLHIYSRSYAYNINDDSDQNGIPDYKDYINGQDNTLVITPTPVVTICPTAEPLVTTVPTIEPTQTATPAVTPFVDEKIDSDGDGLTDVIESKIGTDAQSIDTDGDGLSDFMEMIIGYDPLLQDSNSNGINDPDEDIDEDGLSNIKEMSIGSDILSSDTDCDELKDGEEINVYGTDPLLYDTDGDLIGDGDEVKLGKNPTDPSDIVQRIEQTINTKLLNEEDPSIVSVDVTISLSDSIEEVLDVDDVYNVDVYSTDVVGRIGSPVSVECREAFDKAVIVFHYDDSKLGETKEEDLGVLWFNETTGFYEMQEQAVTDVENNTITVELTHFCTFTIVDRVKWESLSSIQYIVPNTEKDYDYYFAFDMSTSMSMTARNNAIKIFEDIVDEMKEGDRISVIYFDTKYAVDGIYSASNKEEIEALKGRVSRNLSGSTLGGDYGSLLLPFQLADAMIRTLPDNETEKALFILTNDSEQYFIGNYSDTMSTCKERSGFSSHIIITEEKTETDWDFAYQYALATGSDYYKYPEAKGFKDHFIVDYKTISGWNVDSDGDGLPDFFEEQGVKGSNGKTYTSDPFNSDTDGDSVPDNDEYGVVYVVEKEPYDGHVIVRIGNKVVYVSPTDEIEADSDYAFLQQYAAMIGKGGMIIVSRQKSDPNDADSDRDEMEDNKDANAFFRNGKVNVLIHFSTDDLAINSTKKYDEQFLKKQKMEYIVRSVKTYEDLRYELNNMIFNADGKQIYTGVSKLIFVSHGDVHALCGEESDIWYSYDWKNIDNIKNGSISVDSVLFESCSSGAYDKDVDNTKCLAIGAVETIPGVKEVYGWYGFTLTWFDEDYVTRLNSVISDRYTFEDWDKFGLWRFSVEDNRCIKKENLGTSIKLEELIWYE